MHWIANEYAYRRSDFNRCRAAMGPVTFALRRLKSLRRADE
jgi:hypothetical protein